MLEGFRKEEHLRNVAPIETQEPPNAENASPRGLHIFLETGR